MDSLLALNRPLEDGIRKLKFNYLFSMILFPVSVSLHCGIPSYKYEIFFWFLTAQFLLRIIFPKQIRF